MAVVIDDQLYFAGCALASIDDTTNIEWRNELFERYDGFTRKRIKDAKIHPPR